MKIEWFVGTVDARASSAEILWKSQYFDVVFL